MRKLLLRLLLLTPLASLPAPLSVAHATNLATAPIDRNTLPWWHTRFIQSLAQAKAHPNARIIWLGDSITQYWQSMGTNGWDNILPIWNRYYAPYDALDFGFVGDTTSSLIWRLDHGQVAGLHPQLTIILIGANNLGRVHWNAAMTIPGIEAVVANAHQRLPNSHILLLGVLPSIRSAWVDQQTNIINTRLAEIYAGNPTVTFVNVAPVLLHNGKPDPSLYIDTKLTPPKPAIHPDATGMARIAAYIQPDVKRYTE
jgi:lysophospholipase L1-like esterase